MKRLLLIFILIVSSCSEQKSIIDISDKWEGIGYQINIRETWKIEVTKKSKNVYFINYPDIPCSGEWTVVSESQNKITLKEDIKNDTNNCIVESEVIITKINDKNLSVTFFLSNDKAKLYSFGVLEKSSL